MLKYFEDLNVFVATVQKYQRYLFGCFHCGFIWLQRKHVSNLDEAQMQEIQRCLVDLNNWSPTVAELAELEIEISHGLCTPCYRLARMEKNRQEQVREGYHPCFGTANDDQCTQTECKWYNACVVSQDELQLWQQKMALVAMPIPVAVHAH